MRIVAFVLPALVAIALATGCGSGCTHGNHTHATGSTYEEPPNYDHSCRCQENGEISCDTAGGFSLEDEAVASR